MARYDVYANPDRSERKHTPFILDLQNGFLDMLESFVAVPLRASDFVSPRILRIHPELRVLDRNVTMDTPMIATFPKRGLGPPVANLRGAQFDIQDALDALMGDR